MVSRLTTTSDADPDPGWEKIQRQEMNIPDLIFENLVSVFWVKKTLVIFCGSGSEIVSTLDLGSGMEKIGSGILDKPTGSTTPGSTQENDLVLPVMQCKGAGEGPRDLLTELPKTTKL